MPLIFSLGFARGDLPVFGPVGRKEVKIDRCTRVIGLMKVVELKTERVEKRNT